MNRQMNRLSLPRSSPAALLSSKFSNHSKGCDSAPLRSLYRMVSSCRSTGQRNAGCARNAVLSQVRESQAVPTLLDPSLDVPRICGGERWVSQRVQQQARRPNLLNSCPAGNRCYGAIAVDGWADKANHAAKLSRRRVGRQILHDLDLEGY
jgi:hypothetical protein